MKAKYRDWIIVGLTAFAVFILLVAFMQPAGTPPDPRLAAAMAAGPTMRDAAASAGSGISGAQGTDIGASTRTFAASLPPIMGRGAFEKDPDYAGRMRSVIQSALLRVFALPAGTPIVLSAVSSCSDDSKNKNAAGMGGSPEWVQEGWTYRAEAAICPDNGRQLLRLASVKIFPPKGQGAQSMKDFVAQVNRLSNIRIQDAKCAADPAAHNKLRCKKILGYSASRAPAAVSLEYSEGGDGFLSFSRLENMDTAYLPSDARGAPALPANPIKKN